MSQVISMRAHRTAKILDDARRHYLGLIDREYDPDERLDSWYMRRLMDYGLWGIAREGVVNGRSPPLWYELVIPNRDCQPNAPATWSLCYQRGKTKLEIIRFSIRTVSRDTIRPGGYTAFNPDSMGESFTKASGHEDILLEEIPFMSAFMTAVSSLIVPNIEGTYNEECLNVPLARPEPCGKDFMFHACGIRVVNERYISWTALRHLPDNQCLRVTAFYNATGVRWINGLS